MAETWGGSEGGDSVERMKRRKERVFLVGKGSVISGGKEWGRKKGGGERTVKEGWGEDALFIGSGWFGGLLPRLRRGREKRFLL